MLPTEALNEAWVNGFEAGVRNPSQQNPYRRWEQLRDTWAEGFAEGQKVAAEIKLQSVAETRTQYKTQYLQNRVRELTSENEILRRENESLGLIIADSPMVNRDQVTAHKLDETRRLGDCYGFQRGYIRIDECRVSLYERKNVLLWLHGHIGYLMGEDREKQKAELKRLMDFWGILV